MDGIIIINKEKEYTSHDVVAKVKKILGEKIGHTGTLDPNATGVLPLLVGKGTKVSKYFIKHDKMYEVILKLGEKTDTADGEGNIIEKKEVSKEIFKKERIKEVLESFIGKQKQMPPMYSAIKVKGKKLYEYARKGESIEIKPREIEIYEIELLAMDNKKQEICFKVGVSKGTYIRSLCEDIAAKLGTIGYMKELNRTMVGDFSIEDAITVSELEENKEKKEFLDSHFYTIESLFKEKGKIVLTDRELELFLNGVQLKRKEKEGVYRIYRQDNVFIGIGVLKKTMLKRDIIL